MHIELDSHARTGVLRPVALGPEYLFLNLHNSPAIPAHSCFVEKGNSLPS